MKLRATLLAAAIALVLATPAWAAMDVEAGIARLCGDNHICRAEQARAFREFQVRARIGNAVSARAVKAMMFDCFIATGHAARVFAAPGTPIDWRAMLACYEDR